MSPLRAGNRESALEFFSSISGEYDVFMSGFSKIMRLLKSLLIICGEAANKSEARRKKGMRNTMAI
jgi:hypothetical protein